MKGRHQSLVTPIALLVLAGCNDRDAATGANDAAISNDEKIEPATDKWLGQWNGPEGTFLRLEGGKGRYTITIQDLDGARIYQGNSAGGQIHFDRNGATESIRATDGVGTGMKWLSEKSDCLTIHTGEGYCRD